MKKLLLTLLTAGLLFTSTSKAGVFSTLEGMGFKEIKPTVKYTIDTAGVNPRVYEFPSKVNPNYTCVIVFSSSDNSSTSSMQCFPKSGK